MTDPVAEAAERIVTRLRSSVESALRSKARTVDDAEEAARIVGKVASEATLQAIADRWGTGYEKRVHVDDSGVERIFHRHGEREIQTLTGAMRLRRAYYLDRSGEGKGGIFPLDRRLGLGAGGLSPRLEEIVTELGSWVPFERVPALIEKVLGIAISEQTARRVTERCGALIAAEEDREAELLRRDPRAVVSDKAPARLAIAADGVMAHVGGDWREAKIATLFEFDEHGEQRAATKRYVARFGSPEDLGEPLDLEARRAGADRAGILVFLGDGAPWIWNLASERFPHAVCILDYFHAVQHAASVARARFGTRVRAASAWLQMAKARLFRDDVDWLIQQTRRFADEAGPPPKGAHAEDPRLVLARAIDYFRINRDRMRYRTFRDRGLPIGSGVVEAACKTLVQQRLKGPGMRWGSGGAPAVLAARSAVLNRDLEQKLRAARGAA